MLKALCHFLYLSFVLYTTKSRKLFYKSAAYALIPICSISYKLYISFSLGLVVCPLHFSCQSK
nr:MAG TPA: hypothetical protein [Bacteriophage sp.]